MVSIESESELDAFDEDERDEDDGGRGPLSRRGLRFRRLVGRVGVEREESG